jgi:hypothetical protein
VKPNAEVNISNPNKETTIEKVDEVSVMVLWVKWFSLYFRVYWCQLETKRI